MLLGMDVHLVRSILNIMQSGVCSRGGKFNLILTKG